MGCVVEKKTKPIVILIEKSPDSKKSKAVELLLEHLKWCCEHSKVYCNYQFLFLTFSGQTMVYGDRLMDLSDIHLNTLFDQNQVDVSDFLSRLNSIMLSDKLLRRWTTYYEPCVFLLSDGKSEYVNYDCLNSVIVQNDLLKAASRFVVSFGQPVGMAKEFFTQFAGHSNNIMILGEWALSNKTAIKKVSKCIYEEINKKRNELQIRSKVSSFFLDTEDDDIVIVDPIDVDD